MAAITASCSIHLGCGASRSRNAPTSPGSYSGYASGKSVDAPTAAMAPPSSAGGSSDEEGGDYSYGESTPTAAEPTYAAPTATAGPTYSPPPASISGSAVGGVAVTGGTITGAPKATTSAPPPPPPPVTASSPADAAKTTITTTTTVTVDVPATTISAPPPVYPDDQGSPTGGQLTAAIWDDNLARGSFFTFLARYPTYHEQWGLDLSRRVTIRVEDSNGSLVADAPIALRAPDGEIVNLRTHGDGTALFYPTSSMSAPTYAANGQQTNTLYSAAAQLGSLRTETAFAAPSTDSIWTIKLQGVPVRAQTPALDVAIVLDCTGSMGDEIGYLQNEITGVIARVKKEQSMRRVRLGLVLYRDRGDDFVTKTYPFTEDLGVFVGELKTAYSAGGGDMPESVNAALADTVNSLAWAGDETGRLAILVADAPPHYYADEQYTYKSAISDLSARGVKLVTLGASGIDKTTEYVFREMSAYTGGRYVFLTDDSGIGESHLVPDITGYQVEHLDRILVRVIRDEARSFAR